MDAKKSRGGLSEFLPQRDGGGDLTADDMRLWAQRKRSSAVLGLDGAVPRKKGIAGEAAVEKPLIKVVFGAGEERLELDTRQISVIMRQAGEKYLLAKGVHCGREAIKRMRDNSALVELAFAGAIDKLPEQTKNGNLYFCGADDNPQMYRVRKTEKGGVWIDRRTKIFDEKKREWRWSSWDTKWADGNAISALKMVLPPGKRNFLGAVGWLICVSHALRGKITKPNSPKSRLAILRSQASHPVLHSEINRVLFAAVWLAAQGGKHRNTKDFLTKARRVAKLGDGRGARKAEAAAAAELWNEAAAGFWDNEKNQLNWALFLDWAKRFVSSTAACTSTAGFRVVWEAWRACLKRSGGGWEWRGFHQITDSTNKRLGMAGILGLRAGVDKKTAQRHIHNLSAAGFCEIVGNSLAFSAGFWGKGLFARIYNLRQKAVKIARGLFLAATRLLNRFLRKFPNPATNPPIPI